MKKERVDLLVHNAFIVTMDGERRIIPDGALAVRGDTLVAIGTSEEVVNRFTADWGHGADKADSKADGNGSNGARGKTIDAAGKFLFPGFVTTHTHLFQTMLKGLGRDKKLFDWLNSSVRRAYHQFDEETMYYAALTGLIEALRTGTTTVTDFQYCHAKPDFDRPVLNAYEQLGIRGVLSKSHTDASGFPEEIRPAYVESEEDYLRETDELCREYEAHPFISMSIAPGIIWDLSRRGYERTREIADRWSIPITMHLVETPDDDVYAMKTFGKSSVDFLEECGVLGPDFVAVHGVYVREKDFETFKRRGVTVSHCPISNMILASGTAPVPRYLEEGIPVSLACDGAASNDTQNMLEVLKTTALLHKLTSGDAATVSAPQVLEMATLGGARALMMEETIGSLEAGKKADFFLFDPLHSTSVPVHDPVSSLVYSATPANIDTTVVGGRPLLENGRLTSVEEPAVLARAQELAGALVRRSGLGNVQWGQEVRVPGFDAHTGGGGA